MSTTTGIQPDETMTVKELGGQSSGSEESQPLPDKPYSVFSSTTKCLIVLTGSTISLLSPMSSNIYLTALHPIAEDLHVSDSKVNITITTFMIFQAISPVFIATSSDAVGRRPAFLLCLIFYIASNVGLALQTDYASLLGLRCLQSAGSAPTIALASSIAADIASSKSRGAFLGIVSSLQIVGPALSPVFGGLLTHHFGWHTIFWFLTALAAVMAIPVFLFFPETARNVVDNGSIPPPWWDRSVKQMLSKNRHWISADESLNSAGKRSRLTNPLPIMLSIFMDVESMVILLLVAQSYCGIYAVMTSIPSLMYENYRYNSEQTGYLFLAWSAGTALSSFTTGPILDWFFRREARRREMDPKLNIQDMPDFPIEKLRLQLAVPLLALSGVCMIMYGWLLEYRYSVVFVYILEVVFGYWSQAINQMGITLLMDIHPNCTAAAAASSNLIRCLLGAGISACTIPLIQSMGTGWFHTFAALTFVLGGIPLVRWLTIQGVQLRKKRRIKESAQI